MAYLLPALLFMEVKIYQCVLLLAFITGLWLRKENQVPYLLSFLAVAVFFELVLGKMMKYYYDTNILSTNLYSIICVYYYLFLFTREISKKWLWILVAGYTAAMMISAFTQGFVVIMSIAYNSGMIIVMGAIFKYLYDLIIRDHYKPLHQIPLFWMALGILIFYSASFPILNFLNRFIAADYDYAGKMIDMLSIGNIFLSLGYFGAIICQKNIKISSASSL